jgi:hypothetical protein
LLPEVICSLPKKRVKFLFFRGHPQMRYWEVSREKRDIRGGCKNRFYRDIIYRFLFIQSKGLINIDLCFDFF